jgi:hypothetical protein
MAELRIPPHLKCKRPCPYDMVVERGLPPHGGPSKDGFSVSEPFVLGGVNTAMTTLHKRVRGRNAVVEGWRESIIAHLQKHGPSTAKELFLATNTGTNILNFRHIICQMKKRKSILHANGLYFVDAPEKETVVWLEDDPKWDVNTKIVKFSASTEFREAIMPLVYGSGWVRCADLHKAAKMDGVNYFQFRRAIELMTKDGLLEKGSNGYRHPTLHSLKVSRHLAHPVIVIMLVKRLIEKMEVDRANFKDHAEMANHFLGKMSKHLEFHHGFIEFVEEDDEDGD